MDKQLILSEGYNKYYRVSLPNDTLNSENVNFDKLLFFIGTHRPYHNRNEIGSAYMAIRQRTNELLKLDWRNPVLRTSKREVAAIRVYYKQKSKNAGSLFVKIPFKVAYIFKAVAQIVEEIHNDGFNIATELQPLVDKTYLIAFYKEHADAYDSCRKDIPTNMQAQRALNDDFHGLYSPLNAVFK